MSFDLLLYTLSIAGLAIFVYMSLWYVVALYLKRNDVADIAWGIGFFIASIVPLFLYGITYRSLIVTLLVLIWGGRLSLHIFLRNRSKPEDKRYTAWRAEWGNSAAVRSYFQIFILQGILLLLIVSPVLIINTYGGMGLTFFDILGILVWIKGFCYESIGDYQLKKFLTNPANKGHLIETGLWKYTRHPNYFGEVMQWWGLWIIALSVPFGWVGIIGPLTITFLILKVSGVPMLEKSMSANPEFADYKRRTSVFIPWFPKK